MNGARGFCWDACCALNLIATRRAADILSALNAPSYIVREVLEAEVLTLRALPEDDLAQPLITADLSPVIASGALQLVTLSAEEQVTFTAFASEMDDGEARSAAVAHHRGICLVTDDRVSLRVADAHAVRTLTTPEWVQRWTVTAKPDTKALHDCLYRIEVCARYRPRRLHPLYAWWMGGLSRKP